MRYSQLITIVKNMQPKVVVEIGTHNGTRPAEWVTVCKDFMYYGFDLFELGDDKTLAKEGLVYKGGCNMARTSIRLNSININHQLYKGASRVTLQNFKERFGKCIDFAFIDGGHYVPTIRQDWEIIKTMMNPKGIAVFDDYYSGGQLDTKVIGCNEVVKDIPNHFLLPYKDNVVGRLGRTNIHLVQVNF